MTLITKDAAIAIGVVAACVVVILSALMLQGEPTTQTKPIQPDWSCTTDLIPKVAAPKVYLLTDPQGQQFLMTSAGGIMPYTPKASVEKPKE
jgi:hypothetical protein